MLIDPYFSYYSHNVIYYDELITTESANIYNEIKF